MSLELEATFSLAVGPGRNAKLILIQIAGASSHTGSVGEAKLGAEAVGWIQTGPFARMGY